MRFLDVEVEHRIEGREGAGARAVGRHWVSLLGASGEGSATESETRLVRAGPDRDCGHDAGLLPDARSHSNMP